MLAPFWPRRSPHFAKLRALVRPMLAACDAPAVRGGVTPAIAVGLSGGPDSLALAAAVAAETRAARAPGEVSTVQAPRALALCVDHGLQPRSRAVAEKAAQQAREWGLDAHVIPVEVDTDAASLEAAARVARYRAMAQFGVPVMVAHTAEDQAETLILSSLRAHATGMSPATIIEGCEVLRPLLAARRADTVAACAELGVEPWHDPHNSNTDFRRVRIRCEVLPLLDDIVGGDAVGALAQAASAAAADDSYLATAPTDDCAQLAALPGPRRVRALKEWMIAQGIECTHAGLKAVDNLCVKWHGQGGVAVKSLANPGERLEVQRIGGKLALLPMS